MNVTDVSSFFTTNLSNVSSMLSGEGAQLPSAGMMAAVGTAAAAGYMLYEQLRFQMYKRTKKGPLPGPSSVTPILGGIVEMVKDPWTFWERQRKYSCPGMSWNSIVGVFTVFVTDAGLCRHVFNHNGKDSLLLALHPVAGYVLGEHNIAFLSGPEHKALRKSFISLFTRKALYTYLHLQDGIIQRHLAQWVEKSKAGPFEVRGFVRDLNAATSQEVFAGPYLDDPVEREQFGTAYRNMTDAFLCFPIMLPGSGVWKGRQGRKFIVKVLTKAAARSKAKMRTGAEPQCLLDFWSLQVLQDMREAEEQNVPPPPYCTDDKMADSVMDFLFASQDASTASLCWTLALMAEHPDVLARVREEQYRIRGPNVDAPLQGDQLNEMQYTRQVVKEVLRYRPPAPMVPQFAQQPFKLTEDYTAPKGSMIIPSVVAACHQGYENPDKFDPDRFGPERKEDVKFAGNWLVFGHGPHYCVGKEYAQNHLAAFLSRMSTSADWTRVRSKVSDDTIYLPTLYPGDTVMQFTRKVNHKA